MSEVVFPEMPSRYSVGITGDSYGVWAHGTTWGNTNIGKEIVAWAQRIEDKKFRIQMWKMNSQSYGFWEKVTEIEDPQQAVDYIVTATLLGMADFTFLEKEDENIGTP